MKQQNPSNFNENIHALDYAEGYRKMVIDHRTLVSDAGREVESLNGMWRFSLDPYDSFLRGHWYAENRTDENGYRRPADYDWEHWQRVMVPSCWNMTAPEYLYYEGAAIYTRTFIYRPGAIRLTKGGGSRSGAAERVFLKVGAANYETFVFLNGRCLGVHRGGSTPFCVEATEALAAVNRLILVVNNRRERDQVPMDNTDWFNYGGLYRGVSLIRVPGTFIKQWAVFLVPDSGFRTLRAIVETDGPSGGSAVVRIPELNVEQRIPISSGRGELDFDAEPELWSPEAPVLCEVEVSLDNGDAAHDRIGFREIRREGERVLLNGREIYLRGVSCHEESLPNGKAVTRAEIENMIDVARELGCNFVRLAHYPHSEEAARIADEKGVLLWEEIPVYWAIAFGEEKTYADAENQLGELIRRDRNRASVIFWSVGNENPDTDDRLRFMSRLAETARALDPTRLITAACLWDRRENRIADRLAEHLDVIGINEYFGWYEGSFADLAAFFQKSKPGRPVVVSEFGAGAVAGNFGTVDDLFTENKQREVYERQIEAIGAAPYVVGMTPWILFDFRSPRRLNDFQRGFNRKGLVDADRIRRKLAFFTLQRYYRTR